jgi:hypothetical protein
MLPNNSRAFRGWRPKRVACSSLTLMVFALLVQPGCSTIKSEIYSTNGCSEDKTTRHLRGAPITVDVPTHVRIEIVEKKYFQKMTPADPAAKMQQAQAGGIINPPAPAPKPPPDPQYVLRRDLRSTRQVNYDLVTMKELFTVDLKRPLSGTIDYTLGFDAKKQYFTGLKTKTVDTTITDVAALIQTIIASTPTMASLGKIKLTGVEGPPAGANDIVEIAGSVAVEYFNVNDPQLNDKIQEFLETYLNQCTLPCQRPMVTLGAPGICEPAYQR